MGWGVKNQNEVRSSRDVLPAEADWKTSRKQHFNQVEWVINLIFLPGNCAKNNNNNNNVVMISFKNIRMRFQSSFSGIVCTYFWNQVLYNFLPLYLARHWARLPNFGKAYMLHVLLLKESFYHGRQGLGKFRHVKKYNVKMYSFDLWSILNETMCQNELRHSNVFITYSDNMNLI